MPSSGTTVSMSDAVDVIIVGGGLAGSATALHLAQRGHQVCVLERGGFPREKVCGEGLMPHGVEELGALGLHHAILQTGPAPFIGVAYHAAGVTALGDFPNGRRGLGVRRHRIDAVLHRACNDQRGIEMHTHTRVSDVRWTPGHVEVSTSNGPLRSRAIVGADGLNSLVRRKAGLSRPSRGAPRYGIRLHIAPPADAPPLARVEVFLLDELEVYLTPTANNEVNVAVLCGKAFSRSLGGDLHGALLRRLDQESVLHPWLRGAHPLTPAALWGPLRQRTRAVSKDRTLLVGDAAGFIDALTGEGMSLSLVAARLGAEVLSEALHHDDLSRSRLRTYDRRRARHGRDLSMLTELLVRGIRHRWLARWVVRNLARHPAAFSTVLGINIGERPLWRMPPRDLIRLAVGI